MLYDGLSAQEFTNIHALNRAFLDIVGDCPTADAGAVRVVADLRRLDPKCRHSLARCPFLLFSFRETDGKRWEALFESEFPDVRQRDLLQDAAAPAGSIARLAAAALGFLWQCARQSPYTVRAVTGAPPDWCEQLAACTLLELTEFAWDEAAMLAPRLADNRAFWSKLLGAGTSEDDAVREAAHLSALQTVLTAASVNRPLAAAACATRVPAATLHSAMSQSDSHGYNTRPDESTVHKIADENLRER